MTDTPPDEPVRAFVEFVDDEGGQEVEVGALVDLGFEDARLDDAGHA